MMTFQNQLNGVLPFHFAASFTSNQNSTAGAPSSLALWSSHYKYLFIDSINQIQLQTSY